MRQSTTENFQHFAERIDDFKERLAEWLNRKVVAIPLRVLRVIFMMYAAISILIFTYILLKK
jgi:hypothetical protein